jgi:SAM-dependent methyltransferase
MTGPAPLFDRPALARARLRAAREPVLFLQEAMADDVQERLTDVNRRFTDPVVVSALPEIWADRLPRAKVVPDDDTLALEPGAHDLVVHGLALHWANDPVGQLIQCRRALRPDGLLLATLFGGETLVELRQVLAEAEAAVSGGLAPRVAPMGEIRDLGALLQRAGFALPVADSFKLKVSYGDAFALMRDLRGMGETNAMAARLRRPTAREVLTEAARRYAAAYGDAGGRITATFEIVTLTGWAEAPDQPKALRPGSASHRLADVLGAVETPLPPRND